MKPYLISPEIDRRVVSQSPPLHVEASPHILQNLRLTFWMLVKKFKMLGHSVGYLFPRRTDILRH